MKGIIPFLWFDTQAEEAARFYSRTFPGAKFGEIRRFAPGGRGAADSVMTASFELAGQTVVALNGNTRHAFSPASSLLFFCQDEAEAESLIEKLAEGGERQPGGWLKDRYGVSWQVMARQ
jgi:predicted 3-demethylubiquinone-9 3-methyltransferase (glyoxalase superfamily)